jgi:hypothetical protein
LAKAAAVAEHSPRHASIAASAADEGPGGGGATVDILWQMNEPRGWIAGRLRGVEPTAKQHRELARIAAELAAIGPCLSGSVVTRLGPCGKEACSCKADPPRLHGPYHSWTRKVAAKTVTRHLSEEQLEEYQAYIDNDRRLRGLVAELEALTLAIVESDPRWDDHARLRSTGTPVRSPVDKTRSKAR